MCGLVGFIDYKKSLTIDDLQKMNDTLTHRGPDDSGYKFIQKEFANVALAHRRLSILDISNAASQPMSFEHLSIVYNGEVYNFQDIKKQLIEFGYSFNSSGDTEVILKAYHKWGVKAVEKFDGMFVFVIHDNRSDEIFIFRDRAGVKPLYFYKNDSLFLFASELKAFHQIDRFEKDLNYDALAQYFQFGYILQPHTIFKNSYKLKAGHYLKIDLKKSLIQEIEYWSIVEFFNKPRLDLSEDEAMIEVEKLLSESFNLRLVSDVPIGIFLSGGYDSSIVAALLQKDSSKKIKTFTIGFYEDEYNEAPYAKEIAKYLGTEHFEYYCSSKDALNIIPSLAEIFDEPFSDKSAISTILVSKIAKEHVSVVLSADAGDEIFAGYSVYKSIMQNSKLLDKIPNFLKALIIGSLSTIEPSKIPILNDLFNFSTRYEKIKDLLKESYAPRILKYKKQAISYKDAKELINYRVLNIRSNFDNITLNDSCDLLNSILAIDFSTYLVDDILTKVDRSTMSVSLEGRDPFLGYKLIEFVAQLDSSLKFNNKQQKYILKKIAHKHIPKELIDRPKKGFSIPLEFWFQNELKGYLDRYLNQDNLQKQGVLNSQKVVQIYQEFQNGKREYVSTIWRILIFEMWYERWMR